MLSIEWRRSHSPDRHLHVMAIKNNFREASPVLGRALNIIRKEPHVLGERGRDFDEVLNRLNYRLRTLENIQEPELFPNMAVLK